MNLFRKLRTFFFIFKQKPLKAFDLLLLKTERKLGFSLFFLSFRRAITYLCELFWTEKVNSDLKLYGNYYLHEKLLPENPIIFSLGVGSQVEDISFDLALLEQHKPYIYLVDPTPISKRLVDSLNFPNNVQFFPIAVTAHDGEVDLFSGGIEGDLQQAHSVSIYNNGFYNNSLRVTSKRVKTLMQECNVNKLDVLKMDIEGAAIQVLSDTLQEKIFPTQIACEFERPYSIYEVVKYLKNVSGLFKKLRQLNYRIYRTRSTSLGCQIEFLAVHDAIR